MNELIESNGSANKAVGNEIVATRQAQEVQAAMIVAKRFPRDEDAAAARILKACKRPGLAGAACYEYTKGGSKISGPSIRLAEVLAQNWGNIDFGVTELERVTGSDGVGESLVQAHAWDLETNCRRAIAFTVRHWRDTKSGGYALRDEREIYELIANQAARRMRACIMAVIPGDIQDAAVEQCEKTLQGQSTEPLTDRVRKMLAAFDELGVSKSMIELKLGHATQAITLSELARLTKVYTSIRDGFGTREEHFPVGEANPATAESLKEKLQPKKPKTETSPPVMTTVDQFRAEAAECDTARAVEVLTNNWIGPDSTRELTPEECEAIQAASLHRVEQLRDSKAKR